MFLRAALCPHAHSLITSSEILNLERKIRVHGFKPLILCTGRKWQRVAVKRNIELRFSNIGSDFRKYKVRKDTSLSSLLSSGIADKFHLRQPEMFKLILKAKEKA